MKIKIKYLMQRLKGAHGICESKTFHVWYRIGIIIREFDVSSIDSMYRTMMEDGLNDDNFVNLMY